jgi:hypothetical protein
MSKRARNRTLNHAASMSAKCHNRTLGEHRACWQTCRDVVERWTVARGWHQESNRAKNTSARAVHCSRHWFSVPGRRRSPRAPSTGLIAQLNANCRVVDDPLQWVLQRKKGNPRDKNTGWRDRSFCSTQEALLRCIHEYCGEVEALAKLKSLTDWYPDWDRPKSTHELGRSRNGQALGERQLEPLAAQRLEVGMSVQRKAHEATAREKAHLLAPSHQSHRSRQTLPKVREGLNKWACRHG